MDIDSMADLFFHDLKQYNCTNYRNLLNTDLTADKDKANVNKCFSSIVTRYWIFKEKHCTEFTESEFNILYFKLNIDLISKYFSEFPRSDISTLQTFQDKVRNYESRKKDQV